MNYQAHMLKIHNKIITAYNTSVLIHFLLWIYLLQSAYSNVMVPALNIFERSLILYDNNIILMPDFSFFLEATKNFWHEQRPSNLSFYSVENHLQVTSSLIGQETSSSLSFGYSPTMLCLLAPFLVFSNAVAFCIYNLAGMLAVWWQTRPNRCRFGVGLLGFMSPLLMGCLGLGQTALLSGAGLLFLKERSHEHFSRTFSLQTLFCSAVLWGLTAKPPLALTAGGVLLALRQWRPVLLAGLFFVFSTSLLSSGLGPGWMADYLKLITAYNRIEADPAFTSCLFPPHMANLRGILNVDFNLPDDIASRVSSTIWITALSIIIAAGPRLRLTIGGYWSVGLLIYLLFFPHVTSTEVLQVILLLPFCLPAKANELGWKSLVLLFTIPLLPFASPISFDNRTILFIGMLLMLVFIAFYTRNREFSIPLATNYHDNR